MSIESSRMLHNIKIPDVVQHNADQIRAAKDAQNHYKREWYKRNKERVREYQQRYWARRAEREKHSEQPEERGC